MITLRRPGAGFASPSTMSKILDIFHTDGFAGDVRGPAWPGSWRAQRSRVWAAKPIIRSAGHRARRNDAKIAARVARERPACERVKMKVGIESDRALDLRWGVVDERFEALESDAEAARGAAPST